MSDIVDDANRDMECQEALLKRFPKAADLPEFDADGNKICIDCGKDIPEARAALSFVVRCIGCQTAAEKRQRI